MPLGALPTSASVATFSACQSSICALLAIELYSRRERPSPRATNDSFRANPASRWNCTRIPVAGIRPVLRTAAVVCGGVLHVFPDHVSCHLRVAGVERGWTPLGGLRRYVSLHRLACRLDCAGGGVAAVWRIVAARQAAQITRLRFRIYGRKGQRAVV